MVVEQAARVVVPDDSARHWARRSMDNATVLILDPNADEAERLRAGLAEYGMKATVTTDPFHAVAALAAGANAAVIVSAQIGAGDLDTVVAIARQQLSLPVLLAYGPDDMGAIRGAVLAGARPAIPLPYDLRLVAGLLIENLPLRRPATSTRLGVLELREEAYDLRVAETSVALSPQEFELLVLLVRDADRAVSRRTLVRALWPDGGPAAAEDVLGRLVSRIRRKLRPYGVDGAVETIRSFGYRLDTLALDPAAQDAAHT